MKKVALQSAVAEAAGVSVNEVTIKERAGTQIKANALWEGSCSPAASRKKAGVFLASTTPELAFEGAVRRMTMTPPFPDTILVLSKLDTDQPSAKVFGYPDSKSAKQLAAALSVEPEDVPRPVFLKSGAKPETFDVALLASHLSETPNIVLQGPPGTGKSSLAFALIRELAERGNMTAEECRFGRLIAEAGGELASFLAKEEAYMPPPVVWEFVQLHPGYAYDDLVRKVVPSSAGGHMRMVVEDSLFPRLCKLAELRGDKPVVLILDEINRGNLAAILGEFVFAIDPGHRGTKVRLQYQGDGLDSAVAVPKNLWIIGTMNTADRSIAMVDYAVRRRFRFLDVPADPTILSKYYRLDKRSRIAEELFHACNAGLPARLQIGHSAFLEDVNPPDTWAGRMARRMAYHVFPLLAEYAKEGLRDAADVRFNDVDYKLHGQRPTANALAKSIQDMLAGRA